MDGYRDAVSTSDGRTLQHPSRLVCSVSPAYIASPSRTPRNTLSASRAELGRVNSNRWDGGRAWAVEAAVDVTRRSPVVRTRSDALS